MIPVPTPFPAPIAGGGGPKTYQSEFNAAYYKSRRKELQPFFYGRPGSESGTELTPDEKWDLADQLAAESVPFDEEIEAEGFEPYVTMYMRSVRYGMTRVPVGKGRQTGTPVPVNPADFVGPVEPGYLLVSCDINAFPPAK